MRSIGDLLLRHRPHVVALQEMTARHWSVCQQHAAFRDYVWSAPPSSDVGYFTLIGALRSMPFASQRRVPFESSRMGRDVLLTGWPGLVVSTSHLESLNEVRRRRKQVATSVAEAEAHAAADEGATLVFCGDTNINEVRRPPSCPRACLGPHISVIHTYLLSPTCRMHVAAVDRRRGGAAGAVGGRLGAAAAGRGRRDVRRQAQPDGGSARRLGAPSWCRCVGR